MREIIFKKFGICYHDCNVDSENWSIILNHDVKITETFFLNGKQRFGLLFLLPLTVKPSKMSNRRKANTVELQWLEH